MDVTSITYPIWEKYVILSHSIETLKVKDKRAIFHILRKTPEEDAELSILKDYLKSIAKTELSKLNLKSEDILWLSPRTKVLQKEVVPFPDASVIKMWIDENGARRSYADGGDLDPRVYMPGFKAEGYTHLLLLKLPFLIYDAEAFLEKIVLVETSLGKISEYAGTTKTSSKANPSCITLLFI